METAVEHVVVGGGLLASVTPEDLERWENERSRFVALSGPLSIEDLKERSESLSRAVSERLFGSSVSMVGLVLSGFVLLASSTAAPAAFVVALVFGSGVAAFMESDARVSIELADVNAEIKEKVDLRSRLGWLSDDRADPEGAFRSMVSQRCDFTGNVMVSSVFSRLSSADMLNAPDGVRNAALVEIFGKRILEDQEFMSTYRDYAMDRAADDAGLRGEIRTAVRP